MQPAQPLMRLAISRQRQSGWLSAAAALGSGVRALSAAAAAPAADAPPPALSDIMHLDALAGKSADEVEAIWLKFHEDLKQRRAADVMAAEEYRQMRARVRASPMFVLPIGKPGGGFLTMLVNWQGPQALVTTLEEYKRFSGGAPTHMTITHYTDLAASHGVVLARGEVINDHVINMAEGRTLLQLARAFYTDPHAHRLVYRFNHEQSKFDFGELLALLGHKGGRGAAVSSSGGSSGSGAAAAASGREAGEPSGSTMGGSSAAAA